MTTRLYPDSCGDYYPNNWNAETYNRQLNTILYPHDGECLAIVDNKIKTISLIRRILEVVKGFFGFGDITNEVKVNAGILKFLCKGEEMGFIQEATIQSLNRSRVSFPTYLGDKTVQQMIGHIIARHQTKSNEVADLRLKDMHATLFVYHNTNALQLRPGFLSRCLKRPTIDSSRIVDFGDTPLELAKQALAEKPPNCELALNYIFQAHDAHNTTPQFQQKLWLQLKDFLDKNKTSHTVTSQRIAIQNIILKIASLALQHNERQKAVGYLDFLMEIYPADEVLQSRVGECFLENDFYEQAEPFLHLILRYHPNNALVQEKIGRVYEMRNKIPQALEAFKNALELYKSEPQNPSRLIKISEIASAIGSIYLLNGEKEKLLNANVKAIQYYSDALQHKPDDVVIQGWLLKAYTKEFAASPDSFEEKFGALWLNFASSCNLELRKTHAEAVKLILSFCGNEALTANNNKVAQGYLLKALMLFNSDHDYVCDILKTCAEHKLTDDLIPHLEKWSKQHPENFLIKERVGDIYWLRGDKKKAVACYHEAIKLLETKKANNKITEENFKGHMGLLNAKIGEYQISNSQYLEAINALEIAVRNDPTKSKDLFNAYIKAAEEEEKKWRLSYSIEKHVEYLTKAYNTLPQNGKYLNTLFELSFKLKHSIKISNLYLEIQKHEWASEFILKGELLIKVAVQLRALNPKNQIIQSLEKAFELEPKNMKIKEELFTQRFQLAETKIKDGLVDEAAKLLETNVSMGFEGIQHLAKPNKDRLIEVYKNLAQNHLAQAQFEDYVPYSGKDKLEHFEKHKGTIEKALEYYEKAIKMKVEEAALHFEKALILDNYLSEGSKAIEAYLLACNYNKKNPFYNKCLGLAYASYSNDSDKREQCEANIPEAVREEFSKCYKHWKDNLLLRTKEDPIIDPHTFSVVTGWFSKAKLKKA